MTETYDEKKENDSFSFSRELLGSLALKEFSWKTKKDQSFIPLA